MNIQAIMILVIFAAAVYYICRLMYRNLFAKKAAAVIANAVLIFQTSILIKHDNKAITAFHFKP